MWKYIILVFIICLFTLRPVPSGMILKKLTPKVECNKKENIQELIMLPQAPAVPLVKHEMIL